MDRIGQFAAGPAGTGSVPDDDAWLLHRWPGKEYTGNNDSPFERKPQKLPFKLARSQSRACLFNGYGCCCTGRVARGLERER
jgi:hypothetical protein